MEQTLGWLLGLSLAVGGGAMFVHYYRAWSAPAIPGSPSADPLALKRLASDRRAARLSLRRRAQMSAMLATVGLGMAASQGLDPQAYPTVFALLWLSITVLTLWSGLLALLDLLALRHRSQDLSSRLSTTRHLLERELRSAPPSEASPPANASDPNSPNSPPAS